MIVLNYVKIVSFPRRTSHLTLDTKVYLLLSKVPHPDFYLQNVSCLS